jgi:hypothetical protein
MHNFQLQVQQENLDPRTPLMRFVTRGNKRTRICCRNSSAGVQFRDDGYG